MQGSEGEESIDRRSKIVREESLLVSCTWCERLHAPEDPLEFNPICSTCAGVARTLAFRGAADAARLRGASPKGPG
jgi:hypothetical protein